VYSDVEYLRLLSGLIPYEPEAALRFFAMKRFKIFLKLLTNIDCLNEKLGFW